MLYRLKIWTEIEAETCLKIIHYFYYKNRQKLKIPPLDLSCLRRLGAYLRLPMVSGGFLIVPESIGIHLLRFPPAPGPHKVYFWHMRLLVLRISVNVKHTFYAFIIIGVKKQKITFAPP